MRRYIIAVDIPNDYLATGQTIKMDEDYFQECTVEAITELVTMAEREEDCGFAITIQDIKVIGEKAKCGVEGPNNLKCERNSGHETIGHDGYHGAIDDKDFLSKW